MKHVARAAHFPQLRGKRKDGGHVFRRRRRLIGKRLRPAPQTGNAQAAAAPRIVIRIRRRPFRDGAVLLAGVAGFAAQPGDFAEQKGIDRPHRIFPV